MTKQRIHLNSRQIQQDKARAVKRAKNGAIEKCLGLFKFKMQPFMSYILTHDRVILPRGILEEIREEMLALKR